MAGFSFVHSIVQLSLLLDMFEINFLFLGGVAMYDPIIRHDKIIITIVERDT